MKASAEKTSTTTAVASAEKTPVPFFSKSSGDVKPTNASAFMPGVQFKMTANKPGDPFELEADRMAEKVMRAPANDSFMRPLSGPRDARLQKAEKPASIGDEKIQKAEKPATEDRLQKKEDQDRLQRKNDPGGGAPAVDGGTQSSIAGKLTGGLPLSADVRAFMEPRFGADFSRIRVHTDTETAVLSNRLSARAFTYKNHLFFSSNQYQPGTSEGKQLLAHELTHTIQQGYASPSAAHVSTKASTPSVQRLGVQDALDYFADKANYIPGFRLLTIILGFNPISRRSVDRSAANILRALIEVIPGGALITQALDNHGVFTKAGAWVEQQISTLGDIGSDIVAAIRRFLDSLSWTDIFDLGGLWDRAKSIFNTPVGRLLSFAGSVVSGLMRLVKEAILRPLAAMAEGTAGYDLLKAILQQDPITGDPVPRTPETVIGGFMKLIGQEEVWENIKKGRAVARAWAWFQGALSGLMGFVLAIPGKIVQTLASITWQDIVTIVGIFRKVGNAFLDIAGRFMSWAGRQVLSLLEIIFTVVAPGAVPYIKKAQGAFQAIIRNPVGFVGNLVRAGKLGFQMFAARIGLHLKTALIKWIVGPLAEAGVYIPKSFDLMEIIKLVLSVLGVTWQNIRAKLLKIIPEPVLAVLEKTATILVTLVKEGPVAAWTQIKAELAELKGMLIAQITQMVTAEVVKAAVAKLAMMLNPAGAVIQAILAIYNTLTFFIQKIHQIAAVVGSFINSIAAIAAGQVRNAAKRVEQTMADTLTVVLAFLARFAGLGNIPTKIVGIVRRIRQPIDKGLDKIVAWIGGLLKKLVAVAKAAFNWLSAKKGFVDTAGNAHSLYVDDKAGPARLMVASAPMPAEAYLSLYVRSNGPAFETHNKAKITALQSSILKSKDLVTQIDSRRSANPNDPALAGLLARLDAENASISKAFLEMQGVGGKKKMSSTVVSFNIEKPYQSPAFEAEFARQIGMQETRINALFIKDWAVNRHVFVTHGRTGDSEKDKSRRAYISNEVNRLFNASPESLEIKTLRNQGLSNPDAIKAQLEKLVKGRLKGQAVLHTVDQVAGGSGTEFGDDQGIFGSTRVNSSLGSQWTAADRLGKIEKAVTEVSPAVYPTEKMNVKLNSKKA